MQGLLERDIQVISYASDGTAVERSVQRLLEQNADRTVTVTIKNPTPGAQGIEIVIPFFGNSAIATIQDPKHGLKTFRNNGAAGARVITFPTSVVIYPQVRAIAFEDGPLYHRDVDKNDRQDDDATTRLFSAATLEWLAKYHPEQTGLMIYLFVFGELIDAYQNRHISIITRVKMVLRAHFFLQAWEKFLDAAGYPKHKHFISHEAADITRILIRGFLQLVFIYRDHVRGRCPFVPWLLATEACEHVFGICRQIVKDFTMLDFHQMIPKLFIRLREAVFSTSFSDGKSRASGYNHTYTDNRGIDLAALSIYPTNAEIDEASCQAYAEADNLFTLLGLRVSEIDVASSTSGCLPNIDSWFKSLSRDDVLDEAAIENDSDIDVDVLDQTGSDADLQIVLDALEDTSMETQGDDRLLQEHRFALIGLSIDDLTRM